MLECELTSARVRKSVFSTMHVCVPFVKMYFCNLSSAFAFKHSENYNYCI